MVPTMNHLSVSEVSTETDDPKLVGSLFYEDGWTFADARKLLESAELITYDFQFVDVNKCRMMVAWEKVNKISYYGGKLVIIPVKAKDDSSDVIQTQNSVHGSSHASNPQALPDSQPEVEIEASEEPDDFDGFPDGELDPEQVEVLAEGLPESSAPADDSSDPKVSLLSTTMPRQLKAHWARVSAKFVSLMYASGRYDQDGN